MIRIDDREHTVDGKGGWAGRMREWERRRLHLGLSFSLFTSGSGDASRLAGPVVDANRFKTVIRLCKVDVLENVGGSGSRLGAEVSDLRDVGRRCRRLEGRLERLAIGEDDRRR